MLVTAVYISYSEHKKRKCLEERLSNALFPKINFLKDETQNYRYILPKYKVTLDIKLKFISLCELSMISRNVGFKLDQIDYLNCGLAHYYSDLQKEALSDFEEAIKLNPKLVEAWANKGIVLSKLEK